MQRLLIVFAKTPTAGQVKTRLGVVVGAEQAAKIYEEMLSIALLESRANEAWQQIIAITPESDPAYFTRRGLVVFRQSGDDIGQRMSNAIRKGFQLGASQVVLIGSDIPTLRTSDIMAAFTQLDVVPAVIGPSEDGGFYLIGASKAAHGVVASVLEGKIRWSTAAVLAEVSMLCAKRHLPLHFLPSQKDIDTYEDWLEYTAAQGAKQIQPCWAAKEGLGGISHYTDPE